MPVLGRCRTRLASGRLATEPADRTRGGCLASVVFRESAENCTRGGRVPHFNFGFR